MDKGRAAAVQRRLCSRDKALFRGARRRSAIASALILFGFFSAPLSSYTHPNSNPGNRLRPQARCPQPLHNISHISASHSRPHAAFPHKPEAQAKKIADSFACASVPLPHVPPATLAVRDAPSQHLQMMCQIVHWSSDIQFPKSPSPAAVQLNLPKQPNSLGAGQLRCPALAHHAATLIAGALVTLNSATASLPIDRCLAAHRQYRTPRHVDP